jgi:Na+-translocating ferredoxin:NAD+ oxidoreductase RnfD subunit
MMEVHAMVAEAPDERARPEGRNVRGRLARLFPPARTTWLALIVLGGYGVWYLQGLGLASLLALPVVGALADLGFQRLRFDEVRVPDGAIATGLFLALLLPPAVPLLAAGAVAIGAVGLKHVLRRRGRPILNPAASGVVLGAFLFGTAPAWWVSLGTIGEGLMLGLGALLVARNLVGWRLPATFFAVYAPFSIFMRFVLGAALAPKLLILGVLDPATLFFGLFMIVEPRTAPRDPRAQPVYAALVAFGAAFLPTILPSTGILLALLIANLGTAVVPAVANALPSRRPEAQGTRAARRNRARGSRSAANRPSALEPMRWSIPKRVGSGIMLAILVGIIASATAGPTQTPSVQVSIPGHTTPGGGSSSPPTGPTATCASDNPSISSQILQSLHKALGPSVILSYDSSSGTTVFFDPVNQVTITETDLYEDYGYAEFNGDDFAVQGCSG